MLDLSGFNAPPVPPKAPLRRASERVNNFVVNPSDTMHSPICAPNLIPPQVDIQAGIEGQTQINDPEEFASQITDSKPESGVFAQLSSAITAERMPNILIISTAANIGFLILFALFMGIFVFSQPRSINVITSPAPFAQTGYDPNYYYAQAPKVNVNAMSMKLRRDAMVQPVRDLLQAPDVTDPPAPKQTTIIRDNSAVIEYLAEELVNSTTRSEQNAEDKAKKAAALQAQYNARERARRELKSVYAKEIERLEGLQARGLINQGTVEKVKKEALRQDVELRDSLIVAMATADSTPDLVPDVKIPEFRDPHGHDFVSKKLRPLPQTQAHPSQFAPRH